VVCATSCPMPAATTTAATSIGRNNATLNGTVNPNGCNTTVHFQYGTTTNYGSVTADHNYSGNTTQRVIANISGLSVGTTYHFRTVAHNSGGTTYGIDMSFTVPSASATLNGIVDPHGLSTNVHFQYGTTTSYGSTTAPDQSVTGNAYQNVSANISGLSGSTTYHFRIVATNMAGISRGADRTFRTP
jgi:hypothetical protein